MDTIQITDVTLSTNIINPLYVCLYYQAALNLGVTYVQVPIRLLDAIGSAIVPQRTILEISGECKNIPAGFSGYIGQKIGMPGQIVCETGINSEPIADADEMRWIANESLFWEDYPGIFKKLAANEQYAFCPYEAGKFGTALAVEWILAGGRNVVLSFLGTGGYAPLEEVLAALHVYGLLPGYINLDQLGAVARAFERTSVSSIAPHKAVVGSRLFDVESGIHVDGIAKDRRCYEPFAPEAVGKQRQIAIGKHSGKHALQMKLQELGLGSGYNLEKLLELVRVESMQTGGNLSDQAFLALVQKVQEDEAA
jgi:homocitrate synthase NifV